MYDDLKVTHFWIPKIKNGSRISIGNIGTLNIDVDHHFNWFQKRMIKWCFGFTVEDYVMKQFFKWDKGLGRNVGSFIFILLGGVWLIAICNFSRLCFNCHCYVTYNFGRWNSYFKRNDYCIDNFSGVISVSVFYSNGTGDCYNRTFLIYILRRGGGKTELS